MIKTFLTVVFLCIVFMGLGYGLNLQSNYFINQECNKYNSEYNIRTEIEGDFYSWDDAYHCFVLMEDGTRIELDDFEIAAVKKPLSGG